MRVKEVFEKLNKINDGSRTLFESILVPEVNQALADWSKVEKNSVLIGGCALSYYCRPRATTDVDVLFLTDEAIPLTVSGFKRHRKGAFQHNQTHVEIEVVSPQSINISAALAEKAIDTAVESDGVRIASPTGLVALKLERFDRQDQADVENLVKHYPIELSDWPLSEKARNNWKIVNSWGLDK